MDIRVAILGAGFMGARHARSVQEISGAALVAICDVNLLAAQALAGTYGAKAYTSFELLLTTEKPDAVFICLPPFAHNGEVQSAARKGIHIFLEKPIAISTLHAASMVEAVEKSGVCSQVGYHCRFGGAVNELRLLMESDETGIPVLFTGRYECNSLHSPWWRNKDKCGSQVLEQAIHTYDMAMYLMGKPVGVSGAMENLCHRDVPGYTIEDVSASIIRFANGALGAITATNCAVPMQWRNPFSVVFRYLTAHFEHPNKAVFIDTRGEKGVERIVEAHVDMYLEEVRAFIEAIRSGSQSSCPISQGYESLRLVEAVSDSHRLNNNYR